MNTPGNTGLHPTGDKERSSLETSPTPSATPATRPTAGPAPVSRAPLNLGGTSAAAAIPAPAPAGTPAPSPRPAVLGPKPTPPRPVAASGLADRITGCKTFFTKLHPGAIDFLDDQINQWLKDNPNVVIKLTNTTTGEVQGKKTEANILMTVWYHGQATKMMSHMG